MKKILLSLGTLLILGAGCNATTNDDTDTSVNTSTNQNGNTITTTTPQENLEIVDVSTQGDTVTIDVTGQNFSFSKDEIIVRKGQKVTINFENINGTHDWVLDEFDAKTSQINTGQKALVTFTVDKVGEFEYYCSVGQHRQLGMKGKLIVKDSNEVDTSNNSTTTNN